MKFSTNNGFFSADTYVYLNVVFPIPWKIPINKYSPYETLNRFGNHLGSLDLGIKIKIKIADIYFYRQTPYEDGQMPEIFLSGDGNYSLSLDLKEKKRVYRVNIGFLDTRRQAGERSNFARFVGKMETHPGEIQDYLNHGQYIEGWSYHNNAIGTPLIIPTQDLIKESQPKGYNLFTADNRIQAFYMSIFGKIANYVYYLQSSYTSSLGRFGLKKDIPFKQFSSHISINIPIKKSNLDSKIDLSFDSGKLYGNNLGVNFFIIKKWN